MPEISSRGPLVRCPNCGRLSPELPPHSVYRCGGCGALSRAEKRASVDDGLSEKSWEERIGEGENVGFDRGRASDRSATSSRVSKSPLGSAIRDPPIRESDSGGLGSGRKSPMKRSEFGDFDVRSKSSGRSMDGDVRKSPLREKPSVMSVRGGVRKIPVRESVLGEYEEKRSIDREVSDSVEMGAREKVGAWIDHVEEEVEYANRFVAQKGSYDQWSADESELNGPRVQPRSTWRSGKSPMDFGLNPRGEQIGGRADRIVDETEYEYDELYSRRRVEVLHDDWVPRGNHRLPRGHRDLGPDDGYVRNEFGGVHGYDSGASARKRFPVNPIDGPSNFHSSLGYDQPRHSHERFSGSSGLQNAEMNRAELLRRFHEVEEHLRRTGGLPENPTRSGYQNTSAADFHGGYDYDVHDELLRSRSGGSGSLDERDRMRPHRMNNRNVPGVFANDRDMDDVNSFPPSRLVPSEVPFDDDASWAQYPGRTPQGRPHYYPQRSVPDYMPQYAMDSSYDPSGLSSQRENIHHPRNLRTHVQDPPSVGYRRYSNPKTDLASDFPDPNGERASGSRFPYPTPNISSRSQRSVDSKSDGGGSAHERGKRVLAVKKNQLLCHPVAGAAPFVICYSCSQLLRVPKKLIAMKTTQFRLQCGSCHTTLSFNFDKKKPPASMQLQPKPNFINVHEVPSKISESDNINTLAGSPVGITNRESYKFDTTGYTFQSIDSEPSIHLDDIGLNSSEAHIYSDPSLLLDNTVDKNDTSSPLIKSTPDEKATYVSDRDKGSRNTYSLSSSVQNADAPTELDLNNDEIPVPDLSENLAESPSQQGLMRNPPPLHASNAKADVFVNGQPLPHRVVGKAEKLAGPISPGNYWYDPRAGFWGAMGSYCLGIIPPFIKEFGFPLQENCSGGTTGIYVNGRELHEKDLELLASRRLPLTMGKWYVIDISGKVEDEETGEFVVNLGKLAPSVEKAKHGSGMHLPET